jgi:hypothetical protein
VLSTRIAASAVAGTARGGGRSKEASSNADTSGLEASTFSSNIRLALLNRSGTGFFLGYNDRRDTSAFTPADLLGRSFVVKYTRLFDC